MDTMNNTSALSVGILAVFTDYAGRVITCRIVRIDGSDVFCKVIALDPVAVRPYAIGDVMVRDARFVQAAV